MSVRFLEYCPDLFKDRKGSIYFELKMILTTDRYREMLLDIKPSTIVPIKEGVEASIRFGISLDCPPHQPRNQAGYDPKENSS